MGEKTHPVCAALVISHRCKTRKHCEGAVVVHSGIFFAFGTWRGSRFWAHCVKGQFRALIIPYLSVRKFVYSLSHQIVIGLQSEETGGVSPLGSVPL